MGDAVCDSFLALWLRSPLKGPRAGKDDALALFAWLRQGYAQLDREGMAAELGELETNLGMLAARLVPASMRPADLAAVVAAARGALGESIALPSYWDWIGSLMSEAVLQNAVAGVREQHADVIAAASPIVMVTPVLPALIAVANPATAGIEAACARLLMMVVRVGAKHAIVELSFCAETSQVAFGPYLARLAQHPNMGATQLLVVTPTAAAARGGEAMLGAKVVWVDQFASALQMARA